MPKPWSVKKKCSNHSVKKYPNLGVKKWVKNKCPNYGVKCPNDGWRISTQTIVWRNVQTMCEEISKPWGEEILKYWATKKCSNHWTKNCPIHDMNKCPNHDMKKCPNHKVKNECLNHVWRNIQTMGWRRSAQNLGEEVSKLWMKFQTTGWWNAQITRKRIS